MANVVFVGIDHDFRRLWFQVNGRVKPSIGCPYRRCIALFITCDKCKYKF